VLGFVKTTLIGGLLVILPIGLALLLLLKALSTALAVVGPIAAQLLVGTRFATPMALLLILAGCFVVGLLVRTVVGQRATRALEQRVLERVPGYTLLRSLTRRVAGEEEGQTFAVALAVIEDALVPAFIVEEHEDGRYTVFVPSVPTPAVGAVYILPRERVHLVDVPFTRAVRCIRDGVRVRASCSRRCAPPGRGKRRPRLGPSLHSDVPVPEVSGPPSHVASTGSQAK
jgi:uncharacterized membrane protein